MESKLHTFIGETYDSNCFAYHDDRKNMITFFFHFKEYNFFRRVIVGFKYIFRPYADQSRSHGKGRKTCYYAFNLKSEDKTRMLNIVNKLR